MKGTGLPFVILSPESSTEVYIVSGWSFVLSNIYLGE